MPLDFGKLDGGDSADTVLHPREIFSALPNKREKYTYPRDVQTEVWNKWFLRKSEKDLLIKLNTGAGKTVVGLLILKSCLNEGVGPAVYVAPDPFLVEQALNEAMELGIETTEDPKDTRFIRGRAVLIVSIKKLINGKSVFGVGDEGSRIKIGSVVIDDAHACLGTTEQQFTMTLSDNAYLRLFELFKDTLFQQNPSRAMEVESQEPYKSILVPYWAWISKERAVSEILFQEKSSELDFGRPLLKNHLRLCRCVFASGTAEISPRMIPISEIPAFTSANRRIFMSATLSDDSVLVSHFDVSAETISDGIMPSTANDIGERMILVPQDTNPMLEDSDLRTLMVEKAKLYNVVVIVPSGYRAQFWEEVGARRLTNEHFSQSIEELKTRHVGLVVIANRYDGIDLPKEACRILVLDGLPDVRREIDKIQEVSLAESDFILNQRIQRIEQGMGRGIRSTEDYCVVILMGRTLTNWLFDAKAIDKFSNATRAQLKLMDKLAVQLENSGIEEISQAMDYCLKRDPHWIKSAKNALIGLTYDTDNAINPLVVAQREAFNAAAVKDYPRAISLIQTEVNGIVGNATKGWFKAELAEYEQFVDPVKSQEILRAAVSLNPKLQPPMEGITFQRLSVGQAVQSQTCLQYFKEHFLTPNHTMIAVQAILDDLVFRPETANAFEEAVKKVGLLLGFASQRPEQKFKRKGPDNLWAVGELKYYIIEAKNGATGDLINKHDCNQLNGSMNWFREKYDQTCHAIPIMIHPISRFEHACSPEPETRIITRQTLESFKTALRDFSYSMARRDSDSHAEVAALLANYHFTPTTFIDHFTVSFSVA